MNIAYTFISSDRKEEIKMAQTYRACKKCMLLTEENKCAVCNEDTSKEWQGYIVIIDHTRSEIARRMGIASNGKFALRVR